MNECKRCLLREMSDSEYLEAVKKFIAVIKPYDKVTDEVYEHRLAFCKECDYLQNGGCMHCGCFVEMRAAVKSKHCPDRPAKW